MDAKIAKRLKNAAKRLGIEGVDHRSKYSGRSMYGETTHAICVDNIGDFVMLVALTNVKSSEREEFALGLQNIRQDNMGRGIVVY